MIGGKEIVVVAAAIILTTVAIKASDSWFGNKSSGADKNGDGPCPIDMVYVNFPGGGFCIDKYEASPADDCPYANPNSQRETRLNLDYKDCQPVSAPGRIPWRFISQNQAALACAKAGKRLPTNKEWLAAALGTPDPVNNWTADDCQVDDNWNQQPGLTGSGANCISAAGAYDMVGNVWEWVEGTVAEGRFNNKSLPESGYILGIDEDGLPSQTTMGTGDPNYYYDYFWLKETEIRGLARGGYWHNGADAGQYALYAVAPPSFSGAGVGFRCVK